MNRGRRIVIVVVIAAVAALSILVISMLNNDPPVITSLEAGAERVFPAGRTQIVCTATDPDGDKLSYEWSASGGEIDGGGATVTWTAPDEEGDYRIEVTVTDGRDGEDTQHVAIRVKANEPPEIITLTADAAWVAPAGNIQITCDASDPDGDELSYEWSASGGEIDGEGAAVKWTAPEEVGIYDIKVVVRDGHGGSATETLPHISVATGQPPVIEALEVTKDRWGHCYLRFGYLVGQGQKYDIECIASHSDGFELSYEWEWDAGEDFEISEDGSMITWIAPNTSGWFTVSVTVHDIAGNMVSESIRLQVVSCSPCTFGSC